MCGTATSVDFVERSLWIGADRDHEIGVRQPARGRRVIRQVLEVFLFVDQNESPVLAVLPARSEAPSLEDCTLCLLVDRLVGVLSVRFVF